MKRTLVIALAVLFCLSIATAAFAVQTRGTVVSVDPNAPLMIVKLMDGKTLSLVITPKTDIQQGMKDIPLGRFVPGTLVVVRYNVKDGKTVARYIGYESGELQHFGAMKK